MAMEDIIAAAVSEAETGGTVPDPEEAETTTEETPESTEEAVVEETPEGEETPPAEGDEPAKEPAKAAKDEKPKADEGLSKELADLGLKFDKGKDNRMPHSRVAKVWDNARKKLVTHYEGEIKAREDKIRSYDERIKQMDALDRLVDTSPEQFLQILGGMRPALAKHLDTLVKKATDQPAPTDDQMPPPDWKNSETGETGYTPEGLQKLLQWSVRQAKREAVAEVSKDFGRRLAPVDAMAARQKFVEENAPKFAAQVAAAEAEWGKDLMTKHEAEIIKVMQENPKLAFETCVSRVLLPKLRAERTSMRSEILEELKERPKAAKSTNTAGSKTPAKSEGPRTTEDVIRDAIAASGLKG